MSLERVLRQIAFSIILFMLINAVGATRIPATAGIRSYLAFAFTTDWDYRGALAQAKVLTSFTKRLSMPEIVPNSAPEPESLLPDPRSKAEDPLSTGVTASLRTDVPPEAKEPAARPGQVKMPSTREEPPAPVPESRPVPSEGLMWPLSGAITQGFGKFKHPILQIIGPHEGIDIAASVGTPVAAAQGGTVSTVTRSARAGREIFLDHGGGLTTVYAHLQDIRVKAGQTVTKGEIIATAGNTGLTTGPHLHFEVRRSGSPVDPRLLLPQR